MGGLVLGLTLGIVIGQALGPQAAAMSGASPELVTQRVAAIISMIVLWMVTSFLR